MLTATPLLLSGIAALIGAIIVGYTFVRLHQSVALGAALGAVAGAVGPLIFMVPLGYCTFNPEVSTATILFGLLLVAVGTAVTVSGANWLAQWRFRASHPNNIEATSQGLFKGFFTPWLLLLPTLIILAVFLYYPSLDTLRLSTLLSYIGIPRTKFICVENFTTLLGSSEYLYSVAITLIIAAVTVGLGLVLSLLIATAAFQPVKGANVYRTLLIWPYALSPVVAGIVFFLLFSPIVGIINHLLDSVFGLKLPWLTDPILAPIAVILASVWKSLGFGILFYIAGLQNVPNDLREAASIDGANTPQRFWYIVVPLLSPITFFLIITNMSYAFFDIFGTVDVMTKGGPVGATSVMIYKIYQTGVSSGNLGQASAQSILLFVMVIGLTVFQFYSTGRQVNYNA
ncbi:MAG: sugar ABC transporter permease [Chloroflexota bacterium]